MWRRRDEGVDDGNDDKRWVDDFNSSKIIDAALKQNKKTGKDEDESKKSKEWLPNKTADPNDVCDDDKEWGYSLDRTIDVIIKWRNN